jgi:ABC-type phosphate transport system substrate-binding protein
MTSVGVPLVKRIAMTLLGALLLYCAQAHAQVVVIANPSVAATEISRAEVRDIFTGASSSLRRGIAVTPVLQKQGAVQDEFLNRYVGRSDSALRAGWRSILFSGQGVMPKTLDSDAAVVEYVAHTPGAIGYIDKSASHDGVKVLAVRQDS